MISNRLLRRVARSGLLAALTAGSLYGSECAQNVQRELEVFAAPEANTEFFYDSYLMNHSWGQQLVKFWYDLSH